VLATGLVLTPQSSLHLALQGQGASPSKAKATPGPRLPYLGEDAEEGEEEELLLQLEPHAALPSATSAPHPPGSLEAAACSQVLKPRVGPAGVYTLPVLMSLTGSNINISRFGQASRFSFFFFSVFFFSSPHSSCHFHSPQGEHALPTEMRAQGRAARPGEHRRGAGEPGWRGEPAPCC